MKQTGRTLMAALALSALAVAGLHAQAVPRRVALVVGNGAYASNPLKNPPNDAVDVSAALKDAGFEVTLVKDADLTSFEKAVTAFAGSLRGADTGLFYYAGHGVQVDGMNYLIPVSPRIDDAASVKAKAVAVDTVLGKMETSGVRTVLMFLDSCRDNPFPGASRSGTRGLAVVPTPKSLNSLIAYATSPGDTAVDGSGRNGVFSGAFLEYLRQPGMELTEVMRGVRATVARQTDNKQNPRVDDGMKEAFYFVSPDQLAARAQAALEANKAEVAKLEKELADRQARIAATRDAQARQALEVDQQRQEALAVAKRLESENLAREAEKQRKLAAEAAEAAKQKAALAAAQSREQDQLASLAAARRAELERLAQAAASDNPDILIETVERLDAVLAEVDGQYADALARSIKASEAGYGTQLVSLQAQKPDITETDAEFATRIAGEKARLEAARQNEQARLRADAEAQRVAQTKAMRTQYDDTLRTLQTKVWTITGKGATLQAGEFDRNERTWPFTVGSADPLVPMVPVRVVADLNSAPDPKAAILALDAALKAGALVAEIDWGITRDTAKKRYAVDVYAVRVRNLTSGAVVAGGAISQRAGYFVAGKRDRPMPSRGQLGVKLAQYFGDTGPAGGIIFYDKGNYSDGWRFLEAAPINQSDGIQWYNGSYVDVKTATAIGSGKANTAAIIAAQSKGSYAAAICDSLVIGDYDDWFLPSKDELDLMYKNLKKTGLGGFGGVWFWSSSQNDSNYAWKQYFSDGEQANANRSNRSAVRAVRAF